MPNLLEIIAAELECPREMSAQVDNHLIGTYEIDGDAIGSFRVFGRDQRRQDNSRVTAKENARTFLDRLQQVPAD